ncbi:MAG: hypothetical protein IPN67_05510 [Bacteroidales bacterium]|nr:hypothetical protein [Bacteroidales bacterium]
MKREIRILSAVFFVIMFHFTFAAGQDGKSEQRIKIVIADNRGDDIVLDTLITGKPLNDSIVLKNGHTIILAHEGEDSAPGNRECKKYIVTTSSEGDDSDRQINKEITIISSDSDKIGQDSEKTRYVIARDGVVITIEGSDYDKVKKITKEIEKSFDKK